MVRKAWVLSITLLLALGAATVSARPKAELPASASLLGGAPMKQHVVGENDVIPFSGDIGPVQWDRNADDLPIRRDPAYGDSMIIGYTYYDYQANGTIGKQIAKDAQGGVHFTFMKGFTPEAVGNRHVVYNYLQPDGAGLIYAPEEADIVDNGTRSGYCCLTLLPADDRALIFYHVVGPPDHDRDYTGTALGVDFDRGFGAFNSYYPNPFPNVDLIWPKGAAARSNLVHILSTESPPPDGGQDWQRVAYWRGTPNNTFEQWGFNDPPINVDTAGTISSNVCASVTSNKVAMAWFHNRIGADQGPWADFGGLWQRNNDIRYVVSENGRDFDFQRGVRSITEIVPPHPELAAMDLTAAYGDTFRPYCDIDIQFDPWGDDNLYGVFPTQGFFEEPYETFDEDGDPEPCDNISTILNYHNGGEAILWFWNQEADTITMIFNAWYPNLSWKQNGWGSRVGAWRMNADRGSIAFNPDEPGTIYVVWVSFPQIMDYNPDFDWQLGFDEQEAQPFDYFGEPQDTSSQGYSNAEVMVSISEDYGISWHEPINLTQTIWRGDVAPEPGESASEAWASVAYLADDTLHIAYVQDTDAGGVIQTPAEGAVTNSPFVYQRVAIADLPNTDMVQLPRENFQFHSQITFRPVIESALRTPIVPTPGNPVQIAANIVGAGGNAIASAELIYRVNENAPSTVRMDAIQGDTWGASIPAQAAGTMVWYRVRAVNELGAEKISPEGNSWFGYIVRANGALTIHDIQFRPETDGDLPWSDDYSFYKGYEVTVTGVVTTPASFNSRYGGFVIQDAAERWSGVVVRGAGQNVNQGDRVTVTGTVFESDPAESDKWEYATYILATDVQANGQAELPAPIRVDSIAELTFGGGCEALEAVLVEADSFEVDVLTGQAEARTYWPITDGENTGNFTIIGLTAEVVAQAGIPEWAQGTLVERMAGVFTENNGRYAITPRAINDIGATAVKPSVEPNPIKFALNPVYPNPFNAIATVGFSLPTSGWGELGLYDLQGRLVAKVAEGSYEAGVHQFTLDASDFATGVYVLKFEALNNTATQKVVLMK